MTANDILFDDLARLLREPEAEGPLATLREKVETGDPLAWPALIWFLRGAWAARGLTTLAAAELIDRARAAAKDAQADPHLSHNE